MFRWCWLLAAVCLMGCAYFRSETPKEPAEIEKTLKEVSGHSVFGDNVMIRAGDAPLLRSLRVHGPPDQIKLDPILAVYIYDSFGNCVAYDDIPMPAYRDDGDLGGFYADQLVATWTAVPGMAYRREIRNHSSEAAKFNVVMR